MACVEGQSRGYTRDNRVLLLLLSMINGFCCSGVPKKSTDISSRTPLGPLASKLTGTVGLCGIGFSLRVAAYKYLNPRH